MDLLLICHARKTLKVKAGGKGSGRKEDAQKSELVEPPD
ncbi:hypothetical protein Aerorivi_04712 (plasmid) [Aeromonas rivipollensis]|jgi:hypothetical protein